jgi:putative phage-type endonuclease
VSAIVLPVRQQTPEWLAARRSGIGSSDAPIITGDAPWGDLLTLYAVKAGLIDEPPVDTPQTRWGLTLEQTIAEAYTDRTGRKVRRVSQMRQHRELPWMLASLDRMAVGEPTVVEIKTARFPSDSWGPDGSAEIPVHYLVQTQHQMAVVGATRADVPVLFAGSDLRIYQVPRDDSLIDALIALETEFWQCVATQTPPTPLLASRDRRVVPLREGELAADEALDALLLAGHTARQAAKEAKERAEAIDEQVKAALAEWTAARGSQVDVAFKPNKDSERTDWKLVAAAYRKLIDAYEHGRPTPDPSLELDVIESLFTVTTPGARPLKYAPHKEDPHAH